MSTETREDVSDSMLYFKNTDLAETYHISLRTVLNWIESARQGKLDLVLHVQQNRTYVANTSRNIATIERIVAERKKYRNSRSHKTVRPNSNFYKLYDEQQILDIVSNLINYREVPHKYNYFDGGADYWNEYSKRLAMEEAPNFLTSTQSLLELSQPYLDSITAKYKRVNVIDIGVGNGMPVRYLLEHLLAQQRLARYIGLDVSKDMLRIAQRNIHKWFGDRVAFEGHTLDINYDRFNRLLIQDFTGEEDEVINVVLFLGGTLENFRSPEGSLRIINDSMGHGDLLLRTSKLDTEATRQYFDFGTGGQAEPLSEQEQLMADMLGLTEQFYDVEMGYDHHRRERYIRLRLKLALTIIFNVAGRDISVHLHKDDAILLWRYWHYDCSEVLGQLEACRFGTLQATQTEDEQYLLTVSRIKNQW